ncbi:hypothetical protein [Segnochrobactrum spirostomi]|uniref:Lipoprotein n=1 Tax=Segnochrobactrum spirostomi TaxID=2608987 RepID=A0A6A7XYV3_9HYPH|nr:hypothetical protein [Segnochrobactrum spirostomi]MQT11950.1 hypothetical protein [Segnochrobactrum spirostomi]
MHPFPLAALVGLGFALAAGGCMTREQLAQKNAQQVDEICAAHGLQPGTQAYTNCRAKVVEKQQQDEARRQADWESTAAIATGANSGNFNMSHSIGF